MNKKILTGFMSVILTGALALPVCAAAVKEDSTTLTATVDSEYILTIPMDTFVSYGAVNTNLGGTLKVTGNVRSDQQVAVSVKTENFKNEDGKSEFPYTLLDKSTNKAFTGSIWSETELQSSQPKEIPLTVSIPQDTWNQAKAGMYNSKVTFTAELQVVQP